MPESVQRLSASDCRATDCNPPIWEKYVNHNQTPGFGMSGLHRSSWQPHVQNVLLTAAALVKAPALHQRRRSLIAARPMHTLRHHSLQARLKSTCDHACADQLMSRLRRFPMQSRHRYTQCCVSECRAHLQNDPVHVIDAIQGFVRVQRAQRVAAGVKPSV